MRHSVFLLAAALSLAAVSVQAQSGAPILAPIDQAVPVSLPGAAADVVVGNPAIADVQLLNARQAVVMGKGYGVTSLQVFDAQGRSIFARQVVVSSAEQNRVTFYRGSAINSYACAPRCEPIAAAPNAGANAGAAGGGSTSAPPIPASAPTP